MNEYKKYIPNLLTLFRIVFTPFIIILGLIGFMKAVIVISIICAITDMLDGKLARKWKVVSNYGAKLDAISDKVFAIGLTTSLIPQNGLLFFVLIFEIAIASSNLYYYHKFNTIKSLMIGKIKTTFLFISIICSMICVFYSNLNFLAQGFVYATINLQILCLIFYYISHFETNKKNYELKELPKNIELPEDTDKTIEVSNLIELAEKYNLYDKENF